MIRKILQSVPADRKDAIIESALVIMKAISSGEAPPAPPNTSELDLLRFLLQTVGIDLVITDTMAEAEALRAAAESVGLDADVVGSTAMDIAKAAIDKARH